MENIYIVMPAYNEEENVEKVVRQWYRILDGKGEKSRLVIADSGSTDNTHSILERLQQELCKLIILPTEEKQHGPKVIALYYYSIRQGADYIFQTDSDGQTNPDEFDYFWSQRMEYDIVLGWRQNRGDGRSRAFVEHVVCFLLRLYFGVEIPDANAPFRLMKSDVVSKYIDLLPSDYNIPNIMLTTYFAYYKESMCFSKISFKPRGGGINSINLFRIVKIGWKALEDFRVFKSKMK